MAYKDEESETRTFQQFKRDRENEESYTIAMSLVGASLGAATMEETPLLGMAAGAIVGYAVGKKTAKKAIKTARTGDVLPSGLRNVTKLLKG